MKTTLHPEGTKETEQTRIFRRPSLVPVGQNNFLKYIKFCMVGASGVFVDMFVLFLLMDQFGSNLTLSKVLAAEMAAFNNFAWNELWTFRHAGEQNGRARIVRLVKFNLICLGGIVLSTMFLNVQVYALSVNLYLANFISIVIASVWNFLLNLKFNWNTPRSITLSL